MRLLEIKFLSLISSHWKEEMNNKEDIDGRIHQSINNNML